MTKRTQEQKTQRVKERMQEIKTLLDDADAAYASRVQAAEEERQANTRNAQFVTAGMVRRYARIANVILHLMGKGRFNYVRVSPAYSTENARKEIMMPTRAYVNPVGVELQFDWEDRGYTETDTRTIMWNDIFAYEGGKRDFGTEVTPCVQKTVNT